MTSDEHRAKAEHELEQSQADYTKGLQSLAQLRATRALAHAVLASLPAQVSRVYVDRPPS